MSSANISTLHQIHHVALHEAVTLLRTRRVLTVLFLYLVAATLGSLGYVAALDQIETQMMEVLMANGTPPSQAANTFSIVGSEAYQKILAFFVGTDPQNLAPIFLESPFMPVVLGASLFLLPYPMLLLGYDLVISEVEHRTLCFVSLRVSRTALLLGKFWAHVLLFTGLTAVCSLVLLLFATQLKTETDALQTGLGLLRVWGCLIPYGLCYLGMIVLSSTLVTQRRSALTFGVVTLLLFQTMAWTHHLPDRGVWGALRFARWATPSTFTEGLWLADLSILSQHLAALVLFAAAFLVLSVLRLNRRDL